MAQAAIHTGSLVGHCAYCGRVFDERSLVKALFAGRSYELCVSCVKLSREGKGPFRGADIGDYNND